MAYVTFGEGNSLEVHGVEPALIEGWAQEGRLHEQMDAIGMRHAAGTPAADLSDFLVARKVRISPDTETHEAGARSDARPEPRPVSIEERRRIAQIYTAVRLPKPAAELLDQQNAQQHQAEQVALRALCGISAAR